MAQKVKASRSQSGTDRAKGEEAGGTRLDGGELLAAAAHEIKTPLITIGTIASALDGGLHGKLTANQARQIKRVEITAKRLLRVVDGLLGLEKAKSGRVTLNMEPINMLAIIREVLDELEPLAKESEKTVKLSRYRLPPVYADKTFIYQVLYNLVHNAIKYSPPESTITVSAQSDNETIDIVISDQGARLSGDDRKVLFNKFSPLSSRSAMPGSNGLGLYLSAGLVSLLGGQLDHFPGREGNRFHLRLPVVEQLLLFEESANA